MIGGEYRAMKREEGVKAEEEEKKRSNELILISSTTSMENHRNSVIQPLSHIPPAPITTSVVNEMASSSRKRKCIIGIKSVDEMENIQKERNRRVKITEMYSALQSIVPNLRPKATREAIVTDTIKYIKRLEEERGRLEKMKKSLTESVGAKPALSHSSNRNSSVNVSVAGNVAFFGIQVTLRRRLVSNILAVFEKHRADVLAANVSISDQRRLTLSVTAVVGGNRDGDLVEKIKRDILVI